MLRIVFLVFLSGSLAGAAAAGSASPESIRDLADALFSPDPAVRKRVAAELRDRGGDLLDRYARAKAGGSAEDREEAVSKIRSLGERLSKAAEAEDLAVREAVARVRAALLARTRIDIVFVSERRGDRDIYAVDRTGEHLVNLTIVRGRDDRPRFSPDGTRIAFVSERAGDREIYRMGADGRDPVRVTRDPASDVAPSFGPDGNRILFVSGRDGDPEVYLANLEGGETVRLTDSPGTDADAVFSPDGSRIAFRSVRGDESGVFLMRPDGTAAKRVATAAGAIHDLRFSPDGRRIAYSAERDGGADVWIVDLGRASPRRFSAGTRYDHQPAFSPDGRHLAFASGTRDAKRVVVLEIESGREVARIEPAGREWVWRPAFSPDGRELLYETCLELCPRHEIVLGRLDLSTGERREVVREKGMTCPPRAVWNPVPIGELAALFR